MEKAASTKNGGSYRAVYLYWQTGGVVDLRTVRAAAYNITYKAVTRPGVYNRNMYFSFCSETSNKRIYISNLLLQNCDAIMYASL